MPGRPIDQNKHHHFKIKRVAKTEPKKRREERTIEIEKHEDE
jgi:hypothetical protein